MKSCYLPFFFTVVSLLPSSVQAQIEPEKEEPFAFSFHERVVNHYPVGPDFEMAIWNEINDSCYAIGTSLTGRAFYWDGAYVDDLHAKCGASGWNVTRGVAINNDGVCIVLAEGSSGERVSYYWDKRTRNIGGKIFSAPNFTQAPPGFSPGPIFVRDLNNSGVAVGDVADFAGSTSLGVYWEDVNGNYPSSSSTPTAKEALGLTHLYAINDGGMAVGINQEATSLPVPAILYDTSGVNASVGLPTYPSASTEKHWPVDINRHGVIIGHVGLSESSFFPVIWRLDIHGTNPNSDYLQPEIIKVRNVSTGGGRVILTGINDNGIVSGFADYGGSDRAFLWHNGETFFVDDLIPGTDEYNFTGSMNNGNVLVSVGADASSAQLPIQMVEPDLSIWFLEEATADGTSNNKLHVIGAPPSTSLTLYMGVDLSVKDFVGPLQFDFRNPVEIQLNNPVTSDLGGNAKMEFSIPLHLADTTLHFQVSSGSLLSPRMKIHY